MIDYYKLDVENEVFTLEHIGKFKDEEHFFDSHPESNDTIWYFDENYLMELGDDIKNYLKKDKNNPSMYYGFSFDGYLEQLGSFSNKEDLLNSDFGDDKEDYFFYCDKSKIELLSKTIDNKDNIMVTKEDIDKFFNEFEIKNIGDK